MQNHGNLLGTVRVSSGEAWFPVPLTSPVQTYFKQRNFFKGKFRQFFKEIKPKVVNQKVKEILQIIKR